MYVHCNTVDWVLQDQYAMNRYRYVKRKAGEGGVQLHNQQIINLPQSIAESVAMNSQRFRGHPLNSTVIEVDAKRLDEKPAWIIFQQRPKVFIPVGDLALRAPLWVQKPVDSKRGSIIKRSHR